MPSLFSYKKMLSINGNTIGEVHKNDSDLIMEATWDRDLSSQVAYVYDYYHDSDPLTLRNLSPEKDLLKTPIEIKYLRNSSQTYDKDVITYHIQLKPSHKCCINYYIDDYQNKYQGIYPLGMYIDIKDNEGKYNRWLIVDKANYYDPQFSTYEILPCEYIFQWVHNGKQIQMAGVLRSQNSYNSGLWTDRVITSQEDVQKFIVPLNKTSEVLYYNKRMIIDAPVTEREPNTWLISKIKSFAPNCINRITLSQDNFDQHHDYIEKDINGRVIGMWADYYSGDVPLHESNNPTPKVEKSEITYSGIKPEIKIGGSYKTFTMNYYDDNNNVINKGLYNWQFELDGKPFDTTEIIGILYPDITNKLENNQIKIKFIGPDDYLNSILTIKNETTFLNVKIVGM